MSTVTAKIKEEFCNPPPTIFFSSRCIVSLIRSLVLREPACPMTTVS